MNIHYIQAILFIAVQAAPEVIKRFLLNSIEHETNFS